MASNFNNFEWHVGEDRWHGRPTTAADITQFNHTLLSVNEQRVIWGFLRSLLFVALTGIIVSGASLSQSEGYFHEQQARIKQALVIEKAAWQANDRELLAETIDPTVAEVWSPQWRKYWRGSVNERHQFSLDVYHIERHNLESGSSGPQIPAAQRPEIHQPYLFAQLIDQRPAIDWWRISPTRETRVYTLNKQPGNASTAAKTGWLRTIPPPSYWGELQHIETANIRYEFFTRDADLVQAVAPSIEKHYQRLFQTLNLDLLETSRRFTVRIAPDPRRGRGSRSTVIYVTSPLLATIPAQLSDEAYVERFVVEQITAFAVNRAANWRGSDSLQWSTIVWALRSQLEEQLVGNPSPWFSQSEPIFVEYGQDRYPIALDDLTRIRKPKIDPDRRHVYWQQIGAELVIQYAFETYGLDSLPQLVQEFNKSRSWEQLIPNIYGVSAEEFETGFNDFVGKRYGWPD